MSVEDEVGRRVNEYLEGATWPDGTLDARRIYGRVMMRRRARMASAALLSTGLLAAGVFVSISLARGGSVVTTAPADGVNGRTSVSGETTSRSIVPQPVCGKAMPTFPDSPLLHGAHLSVRSSGPGIERATATLTNTTDSQMLGMAGSLLTAVVKDGVVVSINTGGRSIGYTVDLKPGQSVQLVGGLNLVDCTKSSSSSPDSATTPSGQRRLVAGNYAYYAWTKVLGSTNHVDDHLAWGGPWTLTISD